jgi:hypothetical protein
MNCLPFSLNVPFGGPVYKPDSRHPSHWMQSEARRSQDWLGFAASFLPAPVADPPKKRLFKKLIDTQIPIPGYHVQP